MSRTQTDGWGDRIHAWVQLHRSHILQLTGELVAFPTVNLAVDGTEKECQQYVCGLLERMGLETELFSPEDVPGLKEHPAYFPGKNYSHRPNVTGRWAGAGGGRSLIFSSHIDTAPVAPGWPHDPWKPRLEGDRLYGLGVFDMKSGLAASMMAVRCLMDIGLRLAGDVVIESVVDEEFGGANGTLACRLRGMAADAAIVPEPTNLAVCPASRGGALWRVTFRGTAGMAFSGETIVNPVIEAGYFITFLEEYETGRAGAAGPLPWYGTPAALPAMITRVEAGDMNAPLCDSGPAECHVDIWVECYPRIGENELKSDLLTRFGVFCRKHGFMRRTEPEIRKLVRFLPGSETSPDLPLIGMLAEQTALVTGREPPIHGAPFACDAFMFNLYSPTPAVIMGPAGGNAHAPDEFVELPGLYELVEIYARTMAQWCGTVPSDG